MNRKLLLTLLVLAYALLIIGCDDTPTPQPPPPTKQSATETAVVPTATLPMTIHRTKPAINTLTPPRSDEEEAHISPETGALARPLWWPEILALALLVLIVMIGRKVRR